MRYKQLGSSKMDVSVIGMGCWAIGGNKWGVVDDGESRKTIKRAVELGVNFFDTADFYGFGHSEEVLGHALSSNQNVTIATKVGLRWNKKGKIRHDLSSSYIKVACENSLKRLKREVIDLYLIHWPDPNRDLNEAIETFDELVTAGKIRYGGACNLSLEQLKKISRKDWFVAYQGKFNLFNQDETKDIRSFCNKNDIAFIAYEPLYKGMLTAKFKEIPFFEKGDHRKHRKRFTTNFYELNKKVQEISKIGKDNNLSAAVLSLAITLASIGVTTAIPGARRVTQIEENTKSSSIDEALVEELKEDVEKVLSG